jgi:hypothetical protein
MPTNKSNKKNGSADTSAPADTIPYDKAVREGKEIILKIEAAERGQLRLGELADKLEPKYKDRTLAKFAAEIGIAKCTLDRYRTVYRAWEGKLAPGPNLVSYAVSRELATHPDRAEIIKSASNLTKQEAHRLMCELKDNLADHLERLLAEDEAAERAEREAQAAPEQAPGVKRKRRARAEAAIAQAVA